MADSLTVVFAKSSEVNNHLFGKAIRWAQQNPDDLVYWIRRSSLKEIPKVDVNWSSIIHVLKRIKFLYNTKNLAGACINTALSEETSDDVAAMILSIGCDVEAAKFGTLLASMSHYCTQNISRAVVCVQNWNEEDDDGQILKNESFDDWEKGPFVPKADVKEKDKTGTSKMKTEAIQDPAEHLEKLKLISTMYSNNIMEYTIDGLSKIITGKIN